MAEPAEPTAPIYTTGGTVQAGQGLYLPRPADDELFELCRAGTFAYVLAPRQIGKSSLMIRTAECLAAEGVRTVIIDLTRIGTTDVTPEKWYFGLLYEIRRQLHLQPPLAPWWESHADLGYTQRMTLYFEEVLLAEVAEPIVIFVDEIDTTLRLGFTDDFFAAIRAFYHERARVPAFARLSFVLIGVATPGDLIQDPQRTPFNIGKRVEMSDFTLDEALPLAAGLRLSDADARQVLGWALDWTGGHPYLTQRLCLALLEAQPRVWSEAAVTRVVQDTFLGSKSEQDNNLQFVRDMLLKRAPDRDATLATYEAIWRARPPVLDEEQSLIKSHLKLAGVVRRDGPVLRVRNRIYRTVFGLPWIREHLPVNLQQRLRQARGLLVAAVGLAVLIIAAVVFYATQQTSAVASANQTATAAAVVSDANNTALAVSQATATALVATVIAQQTQDALAEAQTTREARPLVELEADAWEAAYAASLQQQQAAAAAAAARATLEAGHPEPGSEFPEARATLDWATIMGTITTNQVNRYLATALPFATARQGTATAVAQETAGRVAEQLTADAQAAQETASAVAQATLTPSRVYAFATPRILTSNFEAGRRGQQIQAVVNSLLLGTLKEADAAFRGAVLNASANYGVGEDGHVVQWVNDDDTAFASGTMREPNLTLAPWLKDAGTGGITPNNLSISIVWEGTFPGGQGPPSQTQQGQATVTAWWQPTDAQVQAGVELIRYLTALHDIPVDRQHICLASDIDTVERWWNPGQGFPLDTILSHLNAAAP